ncbi:MAG: hypothetical protein AAGH64_08105, partial [Planctomycetota bacterium]
QTGPQRLFRAWPFEKAEPAASAHEGDRVINTGAVRIPDDTTTAAHALRAIATEGPREAEPHESVRRFLEP